MIVIVIAVMMRTIIIVKWVVAKSGPAGLAKRPAQTNASNQAFETFYDILRIHHKIYTMPIITR